MGSFFSQNWEEILDEAFESGNPRPIAEGCSSSPNPTCRPRPRYGSTSKPTVLECDPRSPTDGITRTPIEVSSAPKTYSWATYDSRQRKLQDEHTPSMVRDPKHNFSEFDPRSPAAGLDFTRTPIQFLNESTNLEDSASFEDIKQVGLLEVAPVAEEAYPDVNVSDTDHEHIEKMPDVMPAVKDKLAEEEVLKQGTPQDKRVSVSQEVLEAIIPCESSADQENSEVQTPFRTSAELDNMPSTRLESVEKSVLNSSLYLLDTPKSMDKARHQVADKENSSIVKKRIFHTPEMKTEVGAKPKVRTPLGTVGGTNSPIQMLRDKQSNLVKKSLSTRPAQFQQFNRMTID